MEDLSKSFPTSEGMIDAELGSKLKPVNEHCLNCGTKLLDSFCHHCGQKDIPKRQTMKELIENFIGSFFSFESKFFQTVRYLLFKPGFLSLEYTEGKREKYYHPARAYVFISFVFFFFFFSLPDGEEKSDASIVTSESGLAETDWEELQNELKRSGADSLFIDSVYYRVRNVMADTTQRKKKNNNFTVAKSNYASVEEYDSIQAVLPESERDGWIQRKLELRNIELEEKYKDDGLEKLESDFKEAFANNFSKVLFFMLPVFALLFKLLYVRRDYFYSEHLVFSIHYYNFFYLASTINLFVDLIPFVGSYISALITVWIFLYLLLSMKRMYKQNWGKTILKYLLFLGAFFVFMLLGIVGNILFIVMSL